MRRAERAGGGTRPAAPQSWTVIPTLNMAFLTLLLLHAAFAQEWNPPIPPLSEQSYEIVAVPQFPDPTDSIGTIIATEFERQVPVLTNSLRGEVSSIRTDLRQQFDSLRRHMDTKLDRMQRDAPNDDDDEESSSLGKVSAAHTATANIRHNLAMAELRRLGADLTKAMNEEVGKLREEFRASLDQLSMQVQNATSDLAEQLQEEFSVKADESTNMLKKVFFLTRNQMALIQTQLSNISKALSNPNTAPSVQQPVVKPLSTSPAPPTAMTTEESIMTTEIEEPPRDCYDALEKGNTASGLTTIQPNEDMDPQVVWCDQETDGGGWTVMLRRQAQTSQLDFRQNWRTYASGFGEPSGEYWIGLETLHQLTKDSTYALRVDMTWEDEEATSLYDSFSVGPEMYERRGYELQIGGYNKSSTGGDSMEYHNGMDFSTYDEDNDGASGGSCSDWSGGGGWWYNYCYYSNPTGIYPPADLPVGAEVDHLLEWRKWQGYYTYLSSLTMKIRPNYLTSIQYSSF
ncbi:fibrinogen C domain-containing protein 1-like [Penaeus monodon]|uniref:fibrinogen C domain-containing protein 1-like n=1 Tax=Penaeus monodon TaxID=6687 RepID=UPI0018A7AD83|nr:fibrinogen C domain-containing protein 1-like [Penaeus monodon]